MNWIAEVLEKQYKEQPEHRFIFDEKAPEGITFREFYELSGRVYAYLKEKGIGRENFVQITLPRGMRPFIALMGVWRAGAAFVISEDTDPIERIKYIYQNSECKIQINREVWKTIMKTEPLEGFEDVSDYDAAYAVYTSGTTGNPKGVVHEYGNLPETYKALFYRGKHLFAENEHYGFPSSLSFIATPIFFINLLNTEKPKLTIINREIVKDLVRLKDFLEEKKITASHFTPSFIKIIREWKVPSLRTLIVGMEPAIDISPVEGANLYNLYGMSETGYYICVFKIDKRYDLCPVGKPQFDREVFLLNEDGTVNEEKGELCFENPFVRGYINLPEENERAFKNRFYHTNDLAKKLPDGNFVILGRKNDMVKINGNRVEPAEVESVLKKALNLEWCAVRGFEGTDNAYLVAYHREDIPGLDIMKIRKQLSDKLPYYMLPSYFVKIDSIPLNKNGKLDRKALPEPELKAGEIVLPEGDFEKQMYDIVSSELELTEFGVTTNLISLGLSSIKAIKISAAIKKEAGVSIHSGDILQTPYIREWKDLIVTEEEKIDILPPKETYPILANQAGIIVDWARNKENLQYNLPMALKFNNAEPEKLLASLNRVIENHPYFKVRFEAESHEVVVQRRRDREKLNVVFEKLDKEPDKAFFQSRIKPFNLLKDDLTRFEIYYTEKNTYLFLDVHHAIFDGTSANLFISELLNCYEGKNPQAEIVNAYDYSSYYYNWMYSEKYMPSQLYFEKLLDGTESLVYPSERADCTPTGESGIYTGKVPKNKVKEFCAEEGVTENAFFATAFLQVLHRISREENVQISTISNGRSMDQLSGTIGMFVQTLPLVYRSTDTFKTISDQIISTLKNDKFPYWDLSELYNVKPNILYAYQGEVMDRKNAGFEEITLDLDTVKNPLSLNVIPSGDEYALRFEYDKGLYTDEEIKRLSKAVSTFVVNLLKGKTDNLESVPLVTSSDEKEIISLGSGEKLDYDKTRTIVNMIQNNVRLNPKAKAVVDATGFITYGELDSQSDIIANYLMEQGVTANGFVAVKLPRIKEFLISVLGIWKAGCAYVPVDPEYPEDRIKYMTEDSQSRIVIDKELLSKIDFGKKANPINLATPDKLAYMIYTSGSTGRPKGVMVSHLNLNSFVSWLAPELKLSDKSSVAEYSSFSFDASVCDLYPSLASGSTLHIISEKMAKNFDGLSEYIKENKIMGATLPTQLGLELLDAREVDLKYLILGGDKLTLPKRTNTRIYNGYGPTEFTVWSSSHVVDFDTDNDNIPIGKSVPNAISAIIDQKGNLLPRGMAGEIALIGPQISRGYWNRHDLTAEKFAPCPFITGEKMYRTGDLARWNSDGELMFLGRIDNQVKLRGFRIELGEVESELSNIEGIKTCVVLVKAINGIQHLVAYYVAEHEMDVSLIKEEMAKNLTAYMVPDIFMEMDSMPMTPNGKINRKALPVPELKADDIVAPEGAFEKQVFDIVSKELQMTEFGVTTNLISMGLTSIKAIKLSAAIKKEMGCLVHAVEMLNKPFIREWKENIETEEEKIEVCPVQDTYPLTANQMGIYIDWERNRENLQYNIPVALKLYKAEPEKLLAALKMAVDNHPYFKVHFEKDSSGMVVQRRRDNGTLNVVFEKLDEEPHKEFFQSRIKPFDLLNDDLARFEIYYTEKITYLFLDVHHIVFDGASAGVLMYEIGNCYYGKNPEAESINAYDYSLFYDNWLKSENYGKAQQYFENLLEGTEPFMYPSDRANSNATGEKGIYAGTVSNCNVKEFCGGEGVTENAFFAAVFLQVLHKLSREENIQICTISNGRSLEQLSGTVGMLVQTLPLVSRSSDTLKTISDQIISTIRNDKFPYTELVEKYNAKPNVLYAYQGEVMDMEDTGYEEISLALDTVKTPLSLNIHPSKEGYTLLFEYDRGLYTKEEIERLSNAVSTFAANLVQGKTKDIRSVALVSENETRDLIKLGSGKKFSYDRTITVVDRILKHIKSNPNAKAVVDCKSFVTYGELDRQSDIIAAFLREKGVTENNFVAVKLPRIKEFVISVLGIWKAGCAYVPVDPGYPEERINYMVEDSQSKLVIDTEILSEIDFGREAEQINLASPDKLAYMIYTSGSTGKPKGVMVSHLNLNTFVSWLAPELELKENVSVAEYASFSFDASMCDLYPTLVSGATLHIISEKMTKDFGSLAAYMKENNIMGATLPTQLGLEFLDANDLKVKYLILGGDKFTIPKRTEVKLYNGYGPTEFTVWSSHHIVDFDKDNENVPIGKSVPNAISAIVDKNGNLLPKGAAGEIVLIGSQMSRGYWNRPDLTAEKFVTCPFIPGEKMYKTGDLARWNEEGEIMFLGRIDNQVKLRGFRIELGEVESALSKIDGIKTCVALVKNVNGIQHLVAYYVAEHEMDKEMLKAEMSKGLTEYMVPDIFVEMERMPMTPNGKINRKALPEPTSLDISQQYEAPETETEKAICEIYKKVLKLDKYSVTGDFFALGGTSLLAIKTVAELQKQFSVVYGDIFKYKTPRTLASYIESVKTTGDALDIFDFSNFDYSKIDGILQNTPVTLEREIKIKPLGDILITGITGFLGIHILRYLLHSTNSKIYLLTRPKKNLTVEERVKTNYYYYFSCSDDREFSERVVFIEGDITDTDLAPKLEGKNINTVFNCAALVKHYVADKMLEKINTDGIRNLIDCCSRINATLIHMSTSSTSGIVKKDFTGVFDERHLYIGQFANNEYVRTKYMAERYMLQAVAEGRINGKIMRLGNLMGRKSDGEFQMNFNSNAFVNLLKTYATLGVFPSNQLNRPVEMSPIDQVASAIVKLSGTPSYMPVFHPYNDKCVPFKTVLDAINKIGYKIEYVSDADFNARVEAVRNDDSLVKNLQGLLHYGMHSNNMNTKTDNMWTNAVLEKLDFEWKAPDEQYLNQFLTSLDLLGLFRI